MPVSVHLFHYVDRTEAGGREEGPLLSRGRWKSWDRGRRSDGNGGNGGPVLPPPPCGSVNPESDLLVHIYILRDWSTGGTTELLPPVYGLAKAP